MLKSTFRLLTGRKGGGSEDPGQFVAAAREGLALQTSAHAATWHLGEEEGWAADLVAGTITFTLPDGVTAIAPIQVVGTYNTADGTFLWGWDHPSVPLALREHAQLAREWGRANGLASFTRRSVQCDEDEAWGFAAVANRLASSNGVYRGPAGDARVFMTFGEVTLERAAPEPAPRKEPA
jgi:hypothetical protein